MSEDILLRRGHDPTKDPGKGVCERVCVNLSSGYISAERMDENLQKLVWLSWKAIGLLEQDRVADR